MFQANNISDAILLATFNLKKEFKMRDETPEDQR
jgi:hypothetical protein